MVKRLRFYGSSQKDLRAFPKSAREVAGTQLYAVQCGARPTSWKPMPSIGRGVEELRVSVEEGAFRVVYVARLVDHVCVLHAFQKKTQKTSQQDIELAQRRYQKMMEDTHAKK